MVSLFGKKKKDKEPGPRIEKYSRFRKLSFPSESAPTLGSREYKLFKKKEDQPLTWFEIISKISGKIISVNPPDENTKKELENSIAFTGLRIKPKDVMALFTLTLLSLVIISIILAAMGIIPMMGIMFISAGGLGLGYYFLKYPANLMKSYRMQASSQVVLAILYMVVSMRVSPNLEQSLRFSAANVSGPLAWDMRKLLWDIEMGKYYSASDALTDYISKWKSENEEFAEALRLVRDSRTHTTGKAEVILNEALDVILDGTKTRMKHYAQELSLPVSVIHMMGIVLPILGSVMAPMAAVFLSDMARPEYFFMGYNVILPIFLVWFINNVLKKRPTTFSQVDTTNHPDLPPKGSFFMKLGPKKLAVPVMPFAIIIAMIFLIPPLLFFSENPELILSSAGDHNIVSLIMSLLVTVGIAFGLASYFLLSNFQRIKIQRDVLSTESEFEMALFQLGNRISGGIPPELALEKCVEDVKDLSIAGLFIIALKNIKSLGMTFKESLFNEKWGAIRYYPSKLIRNIMLMVVDISKKGVKYAAEGMLTVSKYLRNIRETQEYIRELLQESTSSMTFQAYLLTPMVTGLIVSMAQVIIKVLSILGERLTSLSAGSNLPINITGGLLGGAGAGSTISPEMFQMIIGIYLIEVIIILAMFLTKISQGDNKVYQWHMAGKMLIVAVSMYFLVAVGASTMFSEMITNAVESMT